MRRSSVILLIVGFWCGQVLGDSSGALPPTPGESIYRLYCQPCHGDHRQGYAADNAPSLASRSFLATADDAFLRTAIERGRAGTAMAAFGTRYGGPLGTAQVDELIRYLRGGSKPMALTSRPSLGDVGRGEQVFLAHCVSCHGTASQRGSAVHLANPMFLESASDAYLRVAIEHGRAGTPMRSWRSQLTRGQREDVIAYIRSLARPVPPPPPPMEAVSLEDLPIIINPEGEQATFSLRDDRYVSIAEVSKAFEEQRRLVIIDARPPSEYLRLHIAGSIPIPYFDMRELERVPKDGTWVVTYCACPHHLSEIVLNELRKRGYSHTAVLDEGIYAWQQQGHPTVAAPGQLPIPAPPAQRGEMFLPGS